MSKETSNYWCSCVLPNTKYNKNIQEKTLKNKRYKDATNFHRIIPTKTDLCPHCGYYALFSKNDPNNRKPLEFQSVLEETIWKDALIAAEKRGVKRPNTAAWDALHKYRSSFNSKAVKSSRSHIQNDDTGHRVYVENIDFGLEDGFETGLLLDILG